MATLAIPNATYRLQFNREFTFNDAAMLVNYLHDLGISHCYASPYLMARAGSPHGYDIVDHNRLNPEIGSEEDYRHFTGQLARYGMGQILDIVPNHMGVMGSDNTWWQDVLENGPSSLYSGYFDIDWQPLKQELRGKVLLPVLSDHYGNVLENGELVLECDIEACAFRVRYYEHLFPIDPREYPQILLFEEETIESLPDNVKAQLQDGIFRYKKVCEGFASLPHRNETLPTQRDKRQKESLSLRTSLMLLLEEYPAFKRAIDENIKRLNGSKGDSGSFQALHRLLEAQAWRLAYWRVAGDEINYRRFFDINTLAGIRVEDQEVFDATHALVFRLIENGKLQGLRIDHIDGLYHPLQYLERLNERIAAIRTSQILQPDAGCFYIVAEKIVAAYESLAESWPIAGTSGYEFANLCVGLFVDATADKAMARIYQQFVHPKQDFDNLLYDAKKHIQSVALGSELNLLAMQLNRISESDPKTRDYTLNALRDALKQVVACFPVYRTYISAGGVREKDQRYIDWAIAQARKRSEAADLTVFDFIRSVLLQQGGMGNSAPYQNAILDFTQKFQQYTAPVMAKGLEDTALYNDVRLLSLNDVGGDPRRFGVSAHAFHHLSRERVKQWPHTLLSLSTHDNKRSADVRARISVLTEVPEQWRNAVARWRRMNRGKRKKLYRAFAPSRKDEYLLYQTLIGTWPLGAVEQREVAPPEYIERIQSYMLKAVREAKRDTSWNNPDEAYEQALSQFIDALLNDGFNPHFLQDLQLFIHDILRPGLYNALSQCLLLLTSPGVPDIYQGNELWNFSLVDPDNRSPVDYRQRQQMLDAIKELTNDAQQSLPVLVRDMLVNMEDGRLKLYLIWKTLSFRRQYADLFTSGDYLALQIEGPQQEHLVAFVRHHEKQTVIVVVSRLLTRLINEKYPYPISTLWQDNRIILPRSEPCTYRNVLTQETVNCLESADEQWLAADAVFASLPLALLSYQRK